MRIAVRISQRKIGVNHGIKNWNISMQYSHCMHDIDCFYEVKVLS